MKRATMPVTFQLLEELLRLKDGVRIEGVVETASDRITRGVTFILAGDELSDRYAHDREGAMPLALPLDEVTLKP